MTDVGKKRLLLIAGAAIVAAAIIFFASRTDRGAGSDGGSERVKIELRAKPVATIRMNGKNLGKTPITIVVAKSPTALQLEAEFTVEKYGVVRPAKKSEIWRQTRSVVPDAEQSVDFRIEDATKISESLETTPGPGAP